ncbi:hypothetical protein ABID99_000127 [Mucilaginibacter sp. OAE612]
MDSITTLNLQLGKVIVVLINLFINYLWGYF